MVPLISDISQGDRQAQGYEKFDTIGQTIGEKAGNLNALKLQGFSARWG